MPTDQLVPALAETAAVSAAKATKPTAANLTNEERFERMFEISCARQIAPRANQTPLPEAACTE
jgi:hypothetical protein